jgi:hypothetical protein
MRSPFSVIGIFLTFIQLSSAQQIPAIEENIPYLVTFGKQGESSWGDDDFSQTFFFVVPKFQAQPFYIRVFDPETSGDNDEKKGGIQHPDAFFRVWRKKLLQRKRCTKRSAERQLQKREHAVYKSVRQQ